MASLERRAASICDVSGCSRDAEATVVLVDDETIRTLNREWRGVDAATDVLSFAMAEAEDAHLHPELLGDIVISVETAVRQAAEGTHAARWSSDAPPSPWTLEDELLFLFVHGFLHLLGHDHAEAAEEARMREEEWRLFSALRMLAGPDA